MVEDDRFALTYQVPVYHFVCKIEKWYQVPLLLAFDIRGILGKNLRRTERRERFGPCGTTMEVYGIHYSV